MINGVNIDGLGGAENLVQPGADFGILGGEIPDHAAAIIFNGQQHGTDIHAHGHIVNPWTVEKTGVVNPRISALVINVLDVMGVEAVGITEAEKRTPQVWYFKIMPEGGDGGPGQKDD